MVDIENLKINYFSNEEPVPYKVKIGKELKIYPISIKPRAAYPQNMIDIYNFEEI